MTQQALAVCSDSACSKQPKHNRLPPSMARASAAATDKAVENIMAREKKESALYKSHRNQSLNRANKKLNGFDQEYIPAQAVEC